LTPQAASNPAATPPQPNSRSFAADALAQAQAQQAQIAAPQPDAPVQIVHAHQGSTTEAYGGSNMPFPRPNGKVRCIVITSPIINPCVLTNGERQIMVTDVMAWKQAVKHYHPFVVTVVGHAFADTVVNALQNKTEYHHPVIVYSNNPSNRGQDYRSNDNVFAQCSSWAQVLDAADTAVETHQSMVLQTMRETQEKSRDFWSDPKPAEIPQQESTGQVSGSHTARSGVATQDALALRQTQEDVERERDLFAANTALAVLDDDQPCTPQEVASSFPLNQEGLNDASYSAIQSNPLDPTSLNFAQGTLSVEEQNVANMFINRKAGESAATTPQPLENSLETRTSTPAPAPAEDPFANVRFEPENNIRQGFKKIEIHVSSTQNSLARANLDEDLIIGIDFGAWQFSFRRIVNGQVF
jgi:hypothetical protein